MPTYPRRYCADHISSSVAQCSQKVTLLLSVLQLVKSAAVNCVGDELQVRSTEQTYAVCTRDKRYHEDSKPANKQPCRSVVDDWTSAQHREIARN